ncbi:conserved protein of unknown function precursor containing a type B C-terminal secretion signal [Tenacibaculum sp. 190130A14a]|uniref:Gliding motility-associated C-terminal domain-containing protein n=1 Tax=Tenacibaculum polynesiense TaxID=3137857 RepID=A0ABM9P787_9FLAO
MKYTGVITVLLLLFSATCFSQLEAHLIDKEGWVKGNYVEIGINHQGVFGNKTANKPASFHDNRENVNFLFGFIANPQKDNWVDYDGDFFTPGSPEEGFSIEIDGINYSNNTLGPTEQIPGEVISSKTLESDCFESLAQIEWAGRVNGLEIQRLYSVTENGLFIQMITSITNTSSEIKKDVFFMHNVDPDNNVTINFNYSTANEIISQPDATSSVSLVKASQDPLTTSLSTIPDADGSSVSLYANDNRAKVSFGGFSNRNASDIWEGFGVVQTVGASKTEDEAISIAFNLGDILPNETKTFVYYYILREIDETFVPLIVNISTVNPTGCNTNDGIIRLSGLVADEIYTIDYEKNGVAVAPQDYTANSLGIIEITNQEEGAYGNFNIKYDSCNTELNTVYNLTPPDPVRPVFSETNPSSCGGNDGSIVLSNLNAGDDYLLSYVYNGTTTIENTYTANGGGTIEILTLEEGTYSDFKITYKGCVTDFSVNYTLVPPQPEDPSFSFSNPSNCEGDNGEIVISKLRPNENVVINYQIDGTNAPETTYTSNAAGQVILTNLVNAVYSNFSFVHVTISCSNSPSDSITLNGTAPFTIAAIPDQFYCDNDFDYINTIDLSPIDTIVLGGLDNTIYSVSYHSSMDNATNNIALDKNNYITNGTNTYSLFSKVTNNATGCFEVEEFNITINIPAEFDLDSAFLCKPTDDNFVVPEIDTGLNSSEYTFEWFLNNVSLGFTTSSISAEASGTYKVTVTTIATGCSISNETEIIPSGEPDILQLELVSELFADNHIVKVIASGPGKYLYRLNDGLYQEEPVFENVPAGNNTFYVLDDNGCGETSISKVIIDYPRFFTPNNDGTNDSWHIIGVEELREPVVYIFDRFGKVLHSLDKNSEKWNGTYNGKQLPNNDYWFVLTFIDENGRHQQVKSHFSLLY